ncbi:MAG: YDG domain-containing protein, partial [Bacteroidales bacterium]
MRILNPTFNKTKKLILLALAFVFFNNMLNSQGNLVLEFDDEQADETNVTSPLNSEADVVFDWGDGDRESFTSSDDKTHTNIDEAIFLSIEVYTHEISEITPSTAMSGGKVVADDENSLGDYGVVWSKKSEPTLQQNAGYTIDGTGVGAFESRLTKLKIGDIYYVRAYSKNEVVHEVIYGEQFRFRATQEINIDGSFIAQNKVYDGTIDVEIDSGDLSLDNIVANHDDVSLVNVIGEFEDANAGSDKTVSIVSAELTGSDAFKYRLSLDNTPTAEADIKPKELNVINAEVQNKIYDGNTEAEIMGAELSGVITGDTITFENYEAGNFVQTAAGEGIDVTTAMEISGEAVSNYTLTQPSGLKADIAQKELTIINAQPHDKIYDGNTEAEIMGAELSGVITGDNVTPENHKSGTFAHATVGEDINITTEMDISGDAVSNYTLSQPSDLKADITQKELTVINAEAQNKNYDGNTEAIISGAELSGVVTGDNVTLDNHKTGTFAQAAVGGNIAVTTAITINGIDTQNYDFKNPTGHRANIYQKELGIKGSFTVNDKEHNGTTS